MGLFRRLFSSDFRQAVAAEAAGDYLTAARCYALSGESHKVVDMHLALARSEPDQDHRVRELRIALHHAAPGDRRRAMVLRLLAKALIERGRQAGGAGSAEGREALAEAAACLEQGEAWQQAGDLWVELGEREAAAQIYARGGLVEKVEEALGEEERRRDRALREDQAFKRYEQLLEDGQRDEAAEALRECIEAAVAPARYRPMLRELEERLLTLGRATVRLDEPRGHLVCIGRFPVLIGRDPECDLRLRGPRVSRRHARLLAEADSGFAVEDAGSSHGLLLSGLPVEGRVRLPTQGTLGLGGDCMLRFWPLADPATGLCLEVVSGLDVGLRAVLGPGPFAIEALLPGAPSLHLHMTRGRPMVRFSPGEARLNGRPASGTIQLIAGDCLDLHGRTVTLDP